MEVRKSSIAGADKILDVMEGPVKEPALINPKTGDVPRFYKTRPSFNITSRVTTGMAVLGLVVSANRIYQANDKIREAAKVTTGLTGAWVAMKLAAPGAANIGLQVTAVAGPVAGAVAALLTEVVAGAWGAWMGETIFDMVNPEKR